MNFDKPSPLEGENSISASGAAKVFFVVSLEAAMFIMFYALYTETIGLMNETYLSELPVLGSLFGMLDSDANASHIISMLLAAFSVATPLFIWAEVHRQNIFDDPQEWFSHPQNQILTSVAVLIMIMVIGLEVLNLYTLVAQQSAQTGFVIQQESGVMGFLAQNKGLAIGISAVIAVINIILALFTTRVFQSLKSEEK